MFRQDPSRLCRFLGKAGVGDALLTKKYVQEGVSHVMGEEDPYR